MITINSQLDMTPGAIPVVVHRSQYDSDFSIVFTLFARTGNFTIASGTTAKVRGTKKSGTGYSADATVNVSAKTVTVTGDQQMTVASGQNIFEIVLMSGTKELCSANFILDVERAALDMDTITDDTVIRELDNFDRFITEAEAAADRAEDAAATFSVDATLTVSGKAADAKTVGDAIASEDKKALAAFATDTASGAVANFPDGADSIPMKDVLVHIEPVQEGSGDPSPENVRPITGWTGATISHSGADMTNPTTYSITFPSEAGTVYGGTLDVTKGELTVLNVYLNMANIQGWYLQKDIGRVYALRPELAGWPDTLTPSQGLLCNRFKSISFTTLYNGTESGVAISGGSALQFHIEGLTNNPESTTQDIYDYFAEHETHVVANLATPITYHLTPQEITSLLGTNNVWADTGDSEVEYRADTKVYVDAKVAAAESDITTLQNNKVDMTTPLINLDTSAASGTDDAELYDAIVALGWQNDVIV